MTTNDWFVFWLLLPIDVILTVFIVRTILEIRKLRREATVARGLRKLNQ